MSNSEVKNNTVNYGCNKELLSFVKTKSFFPNSDINNILNTKLNNDETINFSVKENKTFSVKENKTDIKDKSLNTITDKKIINDNNDGTEEIKNNKTDYLEFLQETTLILNKLCTEINLKEENKEYLVQGLISFIESFLQKLSNQDLEYKKVLFFHLKKILGEEYQNKILLIKRAAHWLGLNNLDSNEEYLNFLYKMAELGIILSEDQGIKNEQHSFILTKEEAKKERNALIADDKFKTALTNKMHPLHKDVLNKLRSLNNIIVS